MNVLKKYYLLFIVIVICVIGCVATDRINYENPEKWKNLKTNQKLEWRAVHLLGYYSDQDLRELEADIPSLAAMGINKVILEVDYHFNFQSHPELRQTNNTITKKGAKKQALIVWATL